MRKAKVKAPNVKFRNAQFIVTKLVKPECINWPREIKVAQRLLKFRPELGFWESLDLGFKLNSLAWFISEDGAKRLAKEYGLFKLVLPEPIKYQLDTNVLTPAQTSKSKPNTIKDFLK